jgi:hypothetical protein
VSDASAPRSPFGAPALDAVVIAFAAFTLLAHAAVWRGGSLVDLQVASAVAGVALAAAVIVLRRRTGAAPIGARSGPDPRGRSAVHRSRHRTRLGLALAGAALSAIAGAASGSVTVWWVGATVTVVASLLAERHGPPPARPATRSLPSSALLLGLGLLLAVAVSIAQREDADDAFYVNLVVAGIDDPDTPLLTDDTIHGYTDVPMSLPVFRVISWELAQAAVAEPIGLDGLTIAHVVVPPLVALAAPFAWARLAMRLLPGAWPWVTALAALGLLGAGDGRASHADFALLRLHQGKAVMLHVVLPLCAAYGIELGRAPSGAGVVRLAAAQIAAVGLSASGLWLGPAVAGMGLLSALPLDPRGLVRHARSLAGALLASAYPLALALALRAATVRAVEEAVKPLTGSSWDAAHLMDHAASVVLGDGPYRWLALFALVAACAVPGAPMLRRFAAVSVAAFLLVFFDPWTARVVANGITGAETYFRVFWLVPVPLFVAAIVSVPLLVPLRGRPGALPARLGATVAIAAVVWGWAPRVHTLSAANDVRLARPGPKVPPAELEAARGIAAHAGPEAFVLAPAPIARWIPLLQHHPRPLMAREMYLDRLHDRLGRAELDRRRLLTHEVGGSTRSARGPALLAAAIDDYPLAVVCVGGPALGRPALRRVLLESPLEVVARDADHEIWARPPARASDGPPSAIEVPSRP